jgi:hypothetical protein
MFTCYKVHVTKLKVIDIYKLYLFKDAHDRQYNYMKITIFTLIRMIRLIGFIGSCQLSQSLCWQTPLKTGVNSGAPEG